MKRIKIVALSALVFMIVSSTVIVSCQKAQETTTTVQSKTKKTRQWKKIIDYLGIKITAEGASGCLTEIFNNNGVRIYRNCSAGCPVCWVDIKVGVPVHAPNQDQAFVGEILINSMNNVSLWVMPENVNSQILNNLSDGIFNVDNPFGIGFDKNADDVIIVPNGNYQVTNEANGSYRIDFIF